MYADSGIFSGEDWEAKLAEILNFQINFMKNFVDADVDSLSVDVAGNNLKLTFKDETDKNHYTPIIMKALVIASLFYGIYSLGSLSYLNHSGSWYPKINF